MSDAAVNLEPAIEGGSRAEPPPRRKRSTSPTQRSLLVLRDDGWTCAIVEKWNAHVKRRIDLFGFIDVLALKGDMTLAVQPTDETSVSKHIDKIRASPFLPIVLRAGWRVEVHGWKKPTKTIRRWRQRIVVIGADDVYDTTVHRQAVRTKVEHDQARLFIEDEP